MQKLDVNFEFCYGIKKLKHEFKFSNRTFAIYAPNGVMKTSFAKVFDDYAKGNPTSDLAFPDRQTLVEIKSDGNELNADNVFVIESYNAGFKSDKISTLLANKQLKIDYEAAHKEIDKSLAAFIKKMKQLSGLTGRKDSIEGSIESIFGEEFFPYVVSNQEQVLNSDPLPFHDVKYQLIFNDKVKKFLQTKDFKDSILNYIEKYDQLIEDSPYLGEEFKFHHAEEVKKQLVNNNFFKGGHSVSLSDGNVKNEYESDEALQSVLEEEKKKVFDNDELQATFKDIGAKLTNKELKDFRDYLLDNQEILPELSDLDALEKKLWQAYFVNQKELFVDLAKKYSDGQEEIKKLIDQASSEKTDWEEVIRIFNTRFSHLPFYLKIKNKEDVILKSDVETVEFIFKDGDDEKVFHEKNDLLNILSTGEQRALYILNIIFEVEARKKEEAETVFVVDDIADSFDYKNKYAIIEYLKYMSEEEKFYLLILSHNFDFYRTIRSRGVSSYKQSLIALKNDDGIILESIKYLNNPFINDWKSHLADSKKLIASIPFVRNIIEYTQGQDDADYLSLTSVLHFKDDTAAIDLSVIKSIFESSIQGINFPDEALDTKILDLIFTTADECLDADEGINLENKIVLSIAIRIISEQFMTSKITDAQFLADIGANQNWKLLKKYEEEFNNEKDYIEILKRVNLITPENIHINSFMYEPILDMGDVELRELYLTVKQELVIT